MVVFRKTPPRFWLDLDAGQMVEEADWLAVFLHCFSFLTLKTSFRSCFPPTDLGLPPTDLGLMWSTYTLGDKDVGFISASGSADLGHLGSTWVQQMSVFQGSFGVDVQIASLCSYRYFGLAGLGEPEKSVPKLNGRGQVTPILVQKMGQQFGATSRWVVLAQIMIWMDTVYPFSHEKWWIFP